MPEKNKVVQERKNKFIIIATYYNIYSHKNITLNTVLNQNYRIIVLKNRGIENGRRFVKGRKCGKSSPFT